MPLLTAKGLSKAFGDTVILEDAELHLRQGEKVGLLGVNGSGKSTILRLLAGIDEFDAGELAWRSGTTRTWLPQNPELDPNWTLEQVAIAGVNRSRAGLEGYERELVAHRLLSEVGVQQPQCLVSAASGGTGRRAALAGALLQEPDLLLLDEPTNHLDVETVEWLEAWLRRFAGAVVLITHDRYFLEQVVDRIIEVRRGQLWSFPGTFGTYLQRRLELEAQEARAEAGRKRRLKEELEWLRRSPKARTTKQKARVQRAEGLMDSDYAAREEISLNIYQGRRLGKTILEAKELSAGYDGPEDQIAVVQDLQLTLAKGWRVGIVGPNGAGKTTLLKTLIGELEPLCGSTRLGRNTEVLFIDQHRSGLDPHATVKQSASETGADWVEVTRAKGKELVQERVHVATWLERFLFRGTDLRQHVSTLSGGQKFRLLLARALQRPMNLLALDEPTNDLDLESLSVLEEAVRGYTGCLLVVSHDRAFLDRVCTHILHLPGDGSWTLHTGGWSTWQQTQRQAPQVTKVKRDTQSASASSAAPPKLTYAESIRLDGIEAELESLEAQISALEVKLGQPEVINQHQKLREVSQAHATLSEQRDGLYGLWESLMDKQSAWDDWRNSN